MHRLHHRHLAVQRGVVNRRANQWECVVAMHNLDVFGLYQPFDFKIGSWGKHGRKRQQQLFENGAFQLAVVPGVAHHRMSIFTKHTFFVFIYGVLPAAYLVKVVYQQHLFLMHFLPLFSPYFHAALEAESILQSKPLLVLLAELQGCAVRKGVALAGGSAAVATGQLRPLDADCRVVPGQAEQGFWNEPSS